MPTCMDRCERKLLDIDGVTKPAQDLIVPLLWGHIADYLFCRRFIQWPAYAAETCLANSRPTHRGTRMLIHVLRRVSQGLVLLRAFDGACKRALQGSEMEALLRLLGLPP